MIDKNFTLEQSIREDYKIDIDIFYQNVQYSYKKGIKSYKSIQEYAKEYIRKIKKMYLEIRSLQFEHLAVSELVLFLTELEKKDVLTESEKHLKKDLYNTLIAKRLLNEAISFVGGDSFDKIRRRINNKRNKAKNKRAKGSRL